MVLGIDRISELPDPLLIYILSLLDNMKDSVKTSLLSKKWKYLWTNLDTLVYKCDIKNPSVKKLKRFILFVDNTLMQCTCPKIMKFCIIGSGFVDRLSPEAVKPLVDKWLDFVIEKNVEVVKLGLQELDYEFPVSFFKSSSFVSLEVDNTGRENFGPYRFRKTFDVRWNKLKSLSLKKVYVVKDVMSEILLGCPVLETLVLDGVRGLNSLEITSRSVKELKLLNLRYKQAVEGTNMDITASWVEKLEISGCCSVVRFNLVSVPSLKSASLTLYYPHFLGSFDFDEETDVDPQGHYKDLWLNMIDCLLRPVCCVDELIIGLEILQALSLSKLLNVDSPTFNCKHVTLELPSCVHEVPGIVSLLESSPYLETLVIKMFHWQFNFSPFNRRGHNNYNNCMDKIFPSFSGIDYLSENEHKGKFLHLKIVKIDCTKLNPCDDEDQGSKNMCFELNVVAHIVRNAPLLEKLAIFSSISNCSDFAARYCQLMSSEQEVGNKATGWDLKKRKSSYEFNFC